MESNKVGTNVPGWFWLLAGLGLLWNVFGVAQFVQSLTATKDSLIAMGMTEAQADVMKNYPFWMTFSFAIGTCGGVVGNVLLLLRKKIATPIFAVSLVGYIVLFIGDITEGVFEALGMQQVVILSCVVLIAIGLLWMAKTFEKRHALT